MPEKVIAAIDQAIAYLSLLAIWLIPAGFGRGAWYAYQWRSGRYKLTIGLAVGEAITAVLMAMVGGAVAGRMNLSFNETMGFVGLVSWLGPGGFFAVAGRIFKIDLTLPKK